MNRTKRLVVGQAVAGVLAIQSGSSVRAHTAYPNNRTGSNLWQTGRMHGCHVAPGDHLGATTEEELPCSSVH